MNSSDPRIGLVAGEMSGDRLGASLMSAIRDKIPEIQFEGVGGPLMKAAGLVSLYPMEALSVMGLVEPLKHLPELLRIRRGLVRHFLARPPEVFIGIDAPDFNLGLELKLRRAGIKTTHYVSPSVWAWRQGRIKKIARAVDLMLTLLPFEADFYRQHRVPVTFVGHPLADELPLVPDRKAARAALDVTLDVTLDEAPVLAILPGSRKGEIEHLGRLFLETARYCLLTLPSLRFLIPAANAARRQQLDGLIRDFPDLPVQVFDGRSHDVMAAADAVLLASGTTALEAMLLKKPMVVSYKTGWLSHAIISRMLKVPYVSLPNLLAGEALVPELLQKDATVERLSEQVLMALAASEQRGAVLERFTELHRQLRGDAGQRAADAVLSLAGAGMEKTGD